MVGKGEARALLFPFTLVHIHIYVNAGMKIMKNAGKKMTATPGLPPPVY